MTDYEVGEEVLVERTAQDILKQMDEQLVEVIGVERHHDHRVNEPEREVHVDEARQTTPKVIHQHSLEMEGELSEITYPSARHILLDYPTILDRRQNPEDTMPLRLAQQNPCDGVSLPSMSFSVPSLAKCETTLLLDDEDDGDDVSLLIEDVPPSTIQVTTGRDSVTTQSIQDAVDAIREEASRVEAALAIDQVQTMQNELVSMRKLFQAQADQIEHLKKELKLKDDKLSTMELERDLFKADMDALEVERRLAAADKAMMMKRLQEGSPLISTPQSSSAATFRTAATQLQETPRSSTGGTSLSTTPETIDLRSLSSKRQTKSVQLELLTDMVGQGQEILEDSLPPKELDKECRSQLGEISIVAPSKGMRSPADAASSLTNNEPRKDTRQGGSVRSNRSTAGVEANGESEGGNTLAGTSQARKDSSSHGSRRPSSEGSSKENRATTKPKEFAKEFKPIHPGVAQMSLPKVLAAPVPLRPKTPSKPRIPKRPTSRSSATEVVNDSPSPDPREHIFRLKLEKAGSFPTIGPNRKASPPPSTFSESESQSKSCISAIFRRRKGNKAKRPSLAAKVRADQDSLQAQVDELAERLRSSVEGSQELRMRLAMISRYYESTVHRLHENIVSLREEQAAMKVDLAKQIRSMDRERLMAIKKSELLQKEQQISKFAKGRRQRK